MTRPRVLIVNADDWGLTAGVSRGILHACRHGIVTSTTLLVTRPPDPALLEELRGSGLAVGLHLNLTLGAPVSAAACPRWWTARGASSGMRAPWRSA